jgi:hypothetical protein
MRSITGVKYTTNDEEQIIKATDVIVSAGPWSCQAETWFEDAVQLPMEGVKSTSIVWKPPVDEEGNEKVVDATALFCGEDDRFGTHCECLFSDMYLYWFECDKCSHLHHFMRCGPICNRMNATSKQWKYIPDQTVQSTSAA